MENLIKITKFGKVMHIVELVLFCALTIFSLVIVFSANNLIEAMQGGTGADAAGGLAGIIILIVGIAFLIVCLVMLAFAIALFVINQKMQKNLSSETGTNNKIVKAYNALNIVLAIVLIVLAIIALVVELNVALKIVFSVLAFALAVLHLVLTGMIIKKSKTQNNNVVNNA